MWVVRCVDLPVGATQIETHVGPFYDRDSVDDFLREYSHRFTLLQDIELNPIPHPTATVIHPDIHPDQSTISDYIDPSVVE